MKNELLTQIRAYLRDTTNLSDFEMWIVGNLQRYLDSHDQEAIDVINDVDVWLVQLSDAVIDVNEFGQMLKELIREPHKSSHELV